MRRLMIGVAAAACAAALLVPGGAGARETYDTQIELIRADNYEGDRLLVSGIVLSDKAKCRADRKMKLLSNAGGSFELLDSDRSATSGAWAFEADIDDIGSIKVKAARKAVGNNTCRRAQIVVS